MAGVISDNPSVVVVGGRRQGRVETVTGLGNRSARRWNHYPQPTWLQINSPCRIQSLPATVRIGSHKVAIASWCTKLRYHGPLASKDQSTPPPQKQSTPPSPMRPEKLSGWYNSRRALPYHVSHDRQERGIVNLPDNSTVTT